MTRKSGIEILTNVGTALYGEGRWIRPLAKAINIDEAQVRRWIRRGNIEPHEDTLPALLLEVMKDRETAIIETRHQLVRWIAQV